MLLKINVLFWATEILVFKQEKPIFKSETSLAMFFKMHLQY